MQPLRRLELHLRAGPIPRRLAPPPPPPFRAATILPSEKTVPPEPTRFDTPPLKPPPGKAANSAPSLHQCIPDVPAMAPDFPRTAGSETGRASRRQIAPPPPGSHMAHKTTRALPCLLKKP